MNFKAEYNELIEKENELTDMIKEFIKDGYTLSNGSAKMELIIYFLVKNGSVKLYKNKKFLFWKRRMIEISA